MLVHATHPPLLPLSVVAYLQPLFETEAIVFPHQETETHGKTDPSILIFFNHLL